MTSKIGRLKICSRLSDASVCVPMEAKWHVVTGMETFTSTILKETCSRKFTVLRHTRLKF